MHYRQSDKLMSDITNTNKLGGVSMQTISTHWRPILIFGALMSLVAVHAQQTQETKRGKHRTVSVYDKSSDLTTVRTPTMSVREVTGKTEEMTPNGAKFNLPSETLELMAHYSYAGRSPTIPDQVVLSFLSLAEGEFKYSAKSQVAVVADGSRISLGTVVIADRRSDTHMPGGSKGFLRETLQVTLSAEDYKRLVSASKLRMMLDKTEFTLTKDQLKLLRALFEEWQP
jgi:hypothetical protein